MATQQFDGTWLSAAVADGSTDDYATIQAELNTLAAAGSGGKMLRFPGRDIVISHPLLLGDARVGLIGDPSGGTRLLPQYGSGYQVVVRKPRGTIATGSSLVSGAGNAMRVVRSLGAALLNPSTHPLLDLNGRTAFTVEWFAKSLSTSPPFSIGYYLWTGQSLGASDATHNHVSYAIADLNLGSDGVLRVTWDGVDHDTAAGVRLVNTVQHMALTFDGTTVRLFVAGVQALSFAPGSGTVPTLANNVEQTWIGSDAYGPVYQNLAWGGFDGYIDSIRWSKTCRYTSGFTPPTAKHSVDSNTLLLMNFELDGDWVLGRCGDASVGSANLAYFLPTNGTGVAETQIAGNRIQNITMMGLFGASPLLLHDAPLHDLRHVTTASTHRGIHLSGASYEGRGDFVNVNSICHAWIVGPQAASGNYSHLLLQSGGWVFYAQGAVGGFYSGIISPLSTTYGNVYINGALDIDFHSMQVDDEGQATNLVYSVYLNGAVLKCYGGIYACSKAGKPLFECNQGGSVAIIGAALYPPSGATELVKFHQAPSSLAVRLASKNSNPAVPTSTTPQHISLDGQGLPGSAASAAIVGQGVVNSPAQVHWSDTVFSINISLTTPSTVAGNTLIGNIRPPGGGAVIQTSACIVVQAAPPQLRFDFAAGEVAPGAYKFELARTDVGFESVFATCPLIIRQR